MKIRKMLPLLLILALLGGLWLTNSAQAQPPADGPVIRGGMSGDSVVSPLLQYQARLTDPATGEVVADDVYTMTFSLYDVEAGGSALWTETKGVEVGGGVFSTALGDVSPLALSLFQGQALWLGVAVGTDGEATPRQQILPVAYALSLVPGAVISTADSSPTLQVNNSGSGRALRVEGDVGVYGGLAVLASESHGISARTSSTATGAAGVEGKNTGNGYGVFGYAEGEGPGVYGASVGSGPGGRFYSSSGPAVKANGYIEASRVAYSSPREHYFSVPGEAFVPGSNVDYVNSYGMGGATITSGSGALVAPVNLPHGATVTAFKVFYKDNDATNNLSIYLQRLNLAGGAYGHLAEVSTVGSPGYSSGTDTTISYSVIDNTAYGYLIYVYSTAWNSDMEIMGAVVTYTIDEAP